MDSSLKFLNEYSQRPILIRNKEEAISNLKRAGILDENGNIVDEYKPLIVEKGKDNNDQGSTL